jgi:hypothetical protein
MNKKRTAAHVKGPHLRGPVVIEGKLPLGHAASFRARKGWVSIVAEHRDDVLDLWAQLEHEPLDETLVCNAW